MNTIKYLLENSHLPGPRGNLELLYDFAADCSLELVEECLTYIKEETVNSPEECVGMCGILGFSLLNKNDLPMVFKFLRPYSSHSSWRIRESVAIAIQELASGGLAEILTELKAFVEGNAFEMRAVVAGLCEPKLLNNRRYNSEILKILLEISETLNQSDKFTAAEESLRKALGYGWSVVIAKSPDQGKEYFEKLLGFKSKHINWVIKENLKKNRLIKMDPGWVKKIEEKLK